MVLYRQFKCESYSRRKTQSEDSNCASFTCFITQASDQSYGLLQPGLPRHTMWAITSCLSKWCAQVLRCHLCRHRHKGELPRFLVDVFPQEKSISMILTLFFTEAFFFKRFCLPSFSKDTNWFGVSWSLNLLIASLYTFHSALKSASYTYTLKTQIKINEPVLASSTHHICQGQTGENVLWDLLFKLLLIKVQVQQLTILPHCCQLLTYTLPIHINIIYETNGIEHLCGYDC